MLPQKGWFFPQKVKIFRKSTFHQTSLILFAEKPKTRYICRMNSPTPRVRFAPSPTGKMHVGHLRAAIPNALYALKNKGVFILRFEDTDLERNVAEAENALLDDLEWLGLAPQESVRHGGDFGPYRTMERAKRGDYTQAIEKLMEMGRAYECFVSQDELDVMRKIQRNRNEPPRYDNRHRDLSEKEKEAFRAEGRQPVIRFKLEGEAIEFKDVIRGDVRFEVQHLGGDPVIVRSNGVPLFTLGGVVDDINQKITHVIRGEDHVANTAIQVQIFQCLGGGLPVFAHTPMLLDKEGHKFSKRRGSASVHDLREAGYLPQAIVGYMASLGFSDLPQELTLHSLAEAYPLEGMGRAAVRFDEDQLARTNMHVLHGLSFAEAKDFLRQEEVVLRQPEAAQEAFWQAICGNIGRLAEIGDYAAICFGNIGPSTLPAEDIEYISQALETLPTGPYTQETWGAWVSVLKEKTGRKGKQLFMPLRRSLTGQSHGPELADILPLMGEEKARERLAAVEKAEAAA